MSSELMLSGVGKAYRNWGSEWKRVASWFGFPTRPLEEHWVLQDINLHVGPGETIGLIGQNGAGKSTLLKIVTGTVRPTRGHATRTGRIAAILELGMGFNPDLTGRQNVIHAAGLMGHELEQIQKAMPEIEAFAEIGDYFDQPVRTYSSGMQMRVAFSVATAFKPDILIVDEALSVGDSYFQHKSFDRIRKFRDQGTSILFVSHGMSEVKTLCDRVILLDAGRILKDGAPDEVVDYYNALVAKKENQSLSIEQHREDDGWLQTRSGTREVTCDQLELLDADGNPIKVATVGQKVELRLTAGVHKAVDRLVLGYMLRDKFGHVVWGTNTWHTRQIEENLAAGDTAVFSMTFTCTLGPGSYSVSPALVSGDNHLENNYEWVDNLLVFDVVNVDRDVFIGTNWLDASFVIDRTPGVDRGPDGGVA
ncbi:TPA: ABC transporter ATP-binding protein [Stenotrophomonas maltophilia]|nr:ABC transporter ATP-binding protein [Stenotrophomonas maltophilia]MDU1659034.1 ABC transporter ATP-binding protein [Stenotrophomonas maltophilia]MDZ5775454.1 ABC transporter ATP-binding protein [Stenotrophomonas maltophilia]MDZ5805930.1 ABC transporter ATP-binding protein [Stenotrophomonas maltophilia]WMR46114.1 ABC transporter ATP-binding protein [Stenotrophomonas maltophilia]WMR55583.1 ABC transporter ATP-binding protein [Stenotrophomonas maltophilia]